MPFDIRSRIIEDNLKIHSTEAYYYDILHRELNNAYTLKNIDDDISLVIKSCGNPLPRVLDLGSGTGYLTIPFLRKGSSVDAVDMSLEMSKLCKQKVLSLGLEGRVRFFISEVEQFLVGLKEEFHVIAISSFLHHLYDYMKVLAELDKHLAPGGVIFIAWEPTSRRYARFSLPAKIVDFIDNKFFRLYMKRHNISIPDTDYKYADYHANSDKGCDPDAIIAYFKNKGYDVLEFKNFSGIAKSALAARIHNYFKFSCDHFRIIMKKPGVKSGD